MKFDDKTVSQQTKFDDNDESANEIRRLSANEPRWDLISKRTPDPDLFFAKSKLFEEWACINGNIIMEL